ncbi:Alanine dehydrogenase [Rhodovulum sp. PH10]|uniref:alanine dehydrogenase n=1 Tax=Rhodovulum sp. PH10 TaxID=1187851 RepID=UPI00027C2992|nr:alanine dehydrogenase [Rhodovulum sp. PH10]EJW10099.1 Alanine dehydrogenase [Rhodovulum sp. PH10]
MRIGVPREIKDHEDRVGLIPSAVHELVAHGHAVLVERGAGLGAGHDDAAYAAAGATLVNGPDPVFDDAELIVKVKEPLAAERKRLRRGQTLFTYLHLAPDPEQARDLLASRVTAIAYETVTAADGTLPLLTPMSEVAGRLAPQAGAWCLERPRGGRGVLLGGVAGVPPAEVVVLGGGVVGANAAFIAAGMGADVTVLDRSPDVLRRIIARFGGRVRTVFATPTTIDSLCRRADLVIGAVLVPGATAPRLLTAETVKRMKPGAAIVDVAIDQGGCCETSHPTTHSRPTYVQHDVVHYCVTNMPGAVARTATFAINNATLPFVLALADKGVARALAEDPHLRAGLNVHDGKITHPAVAHALEVGFLAPEEAVGTFMKT